MLPELQRALSDINGLRKRRYPDLEVGLTSFPSLPVRGVPQGSHYAREHIL